MAELATKQQPNINISKLVTTLTKCNLRILYKGITRRMFTYSMVKRHK